MNLAVHGLEGDIREAITYHEDLHKSTGRFDFVLANPPFNVNAVDKERLVAETGPGRRFPFGLPRSDNANYLWIQLFYSALSASGRARRIVQHGDILWSCVRPNRRSHSLVMQPEPNTIASTGFAVLTATKVTFPFLYFATTTDDFVAFLTNSATGAAYPAVTAKTFENADLVIPPAPLLKKFGDSTIPMTEQIHTLQRQTQNLRRTRDLLLPRLLSGQIPLGERVV